MATITLPYVQAYKSRGKVFYYYRRGGQRIRLPDDPVHPEFAAKYQQVHATYEDKTTQPAGLTKGTFAWLLAQWYASPEFAACEDNTKAERRRLLKPVEVKYGHKPLIGLTSRAVYKIRDERATTPVTANNLLRVLKTLLEWSRKRGHLPTNPASDVDFLKTKSDGWKPWPADALARFAKQGEGAARIAYFLALYTGQRRADVLVMRWDTITEGGINIKQAKTGAVLWIPLHQALQAELDRERRDQIARAADRAQRKKPASLGMTIVQRENGQPYTEDGFGTIWNRAQHATGCGGLPFHGLRKNATSALAEAGCTPQQIQAITGHETLGMVQHYSKGANQRRLAKQAMDLLAKDEENKE